MSANARVKPDFDGPEDRQLADDIARAMHHRPLMKRLARVESSHGKAAEFVAKSAKEAAVATPALPAASDMPLTTADPRSIEELIDDLGHVAKTPPSADWLENARRANREMRKRHAIAWVTTLGIAVAIVGLAALLLRV